MSKFTRSASDPFIVTDHGDDDDHLAHLRRTREDVKPKPTIPPSLANLFVAPPSVDSPKQQAAPQLSAPIVYRKEPTRQLAPAAVVVQQQDQQSTSAIDVQDFFTGRSPYQGISKQAVAQLPPVPNRYTPTTTKQSILVAQPSAAVVKTGQIRPSKANKLNIVTQPTPTTQPGMIGSSSSNGRSGPPPGLQFQRSQNLAAAKRLSVGPPSPAPFVGYSMKMNDDAATLSPTRRVFPVNGGLPTPRGGTVYQNAGLSQSQRQAQMPASPKTPQPQPRQPALLPANVLTPPSFPLSATPMSARVVNRPPSLSLQTPERRPGADGYPFPILTPPLTPGSVNSAPSSPCSIQTPGRESSPAPANLARPRVVLTHDGDENDIGDESLEIEEDKEPAVTMSAQNLISHKLTESFTSRYVLSDELGSGGFGFVVKANRIADKRTVAVKFIFKAKIPSHGWIRHHFYDNAGNEHFELIPIEVYALKRVNHKGVVGFVDLFEDELYFYLVMEYHGSPWSSAPTEKQKTSPMTLPALAKSVAQNQVPMSPVSPSVRAPSMTRTLSTPIPPPFLRRSSCDLFECIEQHSKLSEAQARYVFAQIVNVVYYLHTGGICHRDIKDENIVIDNRLRAKLIDFGSATFFDARAELPYHTRFYGTLNFASPEILRGENYRAPSAEIWSLGILFSVLLCGESIFKDSYHVIENKPHQSLLNGLSHDAQDILRLCLHPDPTRRASIISLRTHPYLLPTITQLEKEMVHW